MVSSEKPDKRTAYHEAGHAVMAVRLGIGLKAEGVTFDDLGGHTLLAAGVDQSVLEGGLLSDVQLGHAVEHLMVALAGDAAEELLLGSSSRSWDDEKLVQYLLVAIALSEEEITPLLDWAKTRTLEYLKGEAQWVAMEALAEQFIKHGSLNGEQVEDIIFSSY